VPDRMNEEIVGIFHLGVDPAPKSDISLPPLLAHPSVFGSVAHLGSSEAGLESQTIPRTTSPLLRTLPLFIEPFAASARRTSQNQNRHQPHPGTGQNPGHQRDTGVHCWDGICTRGIGCERTQRFDRAGRDSEATVSHVRLRPVQHRQAVETAQEERPVMATVPRHDGPHHSARNWGSVQDAVASRRRIIILVHRMEETMHSLTRRLSAMIGTGVLFILLAFSTSVTSSQAAEPTAPPPAQEKAVQKGDLGQVQERAVRGSGGATLGFTCGATECTCTGDIDCNNMFSSGKCNGPILDNDCNTTNPLVPVCHCLMSKTQPPKGNRLAPGRLPLQNASGAPAPPKFDPRAGVAPLGTVPLRSRGVEGAPATSAPTEQKDTTPAPK